LAGVEGDEGDEGDEGVGGSAEIDYSYRIVLDRLA